MVNKSTENPAGTINYRDQEALGRHRYLGLLRYKDWEAGYCNACEGIFNVECPQCHASSGTQHGGVGESLFLVTRPIATELYDNFAWTPVICAACDFRFKVIVH